MTALPPRDWNLPLDRDAIIEGGPRLYGYLKSLVNSLDESTENLSNGLYGSSGTFLPVAEGASSAGSGTYDTQLGMYVVIGSLCWVTINLEFTDANHSGTGNLLITGLPFTSHNVTGHNTVLSTLNTGDFSGTSIIAAGAKQISDIRDETGTQQTITGKDYDLVITGVYRIATN